MEVFEQFKEKFLVKAGIDQNYKFSIRASENELEEWFDSNQVQAGVKPAKDGLMSDLEIAITRLIIDKANEIASGRKEASIEVELLTQVVIPLVKELER